MKKILFIISVLSIPVAGFFQTTNYVMDFNGTGVSDDLGNSVGNSLRSIEFWFKPNVTFNSSSSSTGTMLIRDDLSQTHEFGIYLTGTDMTSNFGKIAFYVRYSGVNHTIFSNSNSWAAGTWYHVAGVIDPSLGMLLYVDGVLQTNTDATATAATDVDNASPTMLGRWPTVTRYFNGRIDELRMWNRAITQSEIQTKKCLDLTPSAETGMVAYYKFNEGSGSQILDATVNTYNGTVGGTTWLVDNACSTSSNYVMDCNGTGNSDNLGNTVGNSLRSIEFWFKPNVTFNSSSSSTGTMLIRDDLSQTHEFGIYLTGTDMTSNFGKIAFYVRYSGVNHTIFSNSNSWIAGTWYHVAGVIDPSLGMLLYVDGVLQTNTDATATAVTDVDNANPTVLGRWPTVTRYYNGRMDELRMWNRAITQSEIQTKMCQNLTPSGETGLMGYYKFDEGGGSQVFDATSNAYNGTVSGTTWISETFCTTGIQINSLLENSVVIYPNPTSGIVNINIKNSGGNGIYIVTNSMGQTVKTGKLFEVENCLNLSNLDNGIYFISVKKDNETAVKKIIIEK